LRKACARDTAPCAVASCGAGYVARSQEVHCHSRVPNTLRRIRQIRGCTAAAGAAAYCLGSATERQDLPQPPRADEDHAAERAPATGLAGSSTGTLAATNLPLLSE